MKMRANYLVWFLAMWTIGCSSGPTDLPAELAAAESGTIIEVTAGEYVGNFVVPAGVSLRGEEGVVIRGEAGSPALTLQPSADASVASSLEGMTVYSDDVGILTSGTGHVALQDITVHAALGTAVVLSGCTANLTNVDLVGMIEGPDSSALMLGNLFESDQVSVMGLAATQADLTISNLNIMGFVGFGAALFQSTAIRDGGLLKWIVGVGVMNESSTLTLENVSIQDSLQSRDAGSKRPSYGLVSSTGSTTTTSSVTIERIQGAGLLVHDALSNTHDAIKISQCDATGAHVQNGRGTTDFTGAEFHDNQKAGLSFLKAGSVQLTDSGVFNTQAVGAQITSNDLVLGHGLQIAEGDAQVNMSGVLLEDNEIVGLLLDGDNLSVTASDVTIGLRDLACSDDYADCFGVQSQNGASLPESGFNVSADLGTANQGLGLFPVTQQQVVQKIDLLGEWIGEDGYVAGNTIQIGENGIQ